MRGYRFSLAAIACLVACLYSFPASAVIVHHCDYGEVSEQVHNTHEGDGDPDDCGNENGTGQPAHAEGTCEHSSAFYWTWMECYGGTCQIQGTIDCSNGDKSYSFTCTNASGKTPLAGAGRHQAACNSDTESKFCGCSSPGFYCN